MSESFVEAPFEFNWPEHPSEEQIKFAATLFEEWFLDNEIKKGKKPIEARDVLQEKINRGLYFSLMRFLFSKDLHDGKSECYYEGIVKELKKAYISSSGVGTGAGSYTSHSVAEKDLPEQ